MTLLGISYQFTIPNITAALQDYDQARIYKAAAQAGPYDYLTSVALETGVSSYAVRDEAGLPSDFYAHELFHSTTLSVSARSEPVPGSVEPVYTRQTLRRLTAMEVERYAYPPIEYTAPSPSGTTTAAGTTTTVVDSTYALPDLPTDFLRGWSLLINDGDQAGRERRVTAFDPATGTFTLAPALPGAPGTLATFDLYGEAPAGWWNDRLNEARLDVWYPFRYPVAGVSGQTEYVLPEWIASSHQITRMVRQTGTVIGGETRSLGYPFEVIERDGGGISLYAPSLGSGAIWWLEGRRNPPELLSDSATVVLDDQRARLFVVTAAQQAAQRLARPAGASEDRSVWAQVAAELELKRRGLSRAIGQFQVQRSARPDELIGVSTGYEF